MSEIDHKKLFQKYRDGDTLTDIELHHLIIRCQLISDALSNTGDIYLLVRVNNNQMLANLKDYRDARKRNA